MSEELKRLGEMELKIGILEKDVSQLDRFSERLLISIEKIQDVSNKLLQMLALHEQKMAQNDEQNKIVHNLIERRRSEINDDVKELHSRITTVQRELNDRIETVENTISSKIDSVLEKMENEIKNQNSNGGFEKWKWAAMGGVVCVSWMLSHLKLDTLSSLVK